MQKRLVRVNNAVLDIDSSVDNQQQIDLQIQNNTDAMNSMSPAVTKALINLITDGRTGNIGNTDNEDLLARLSNYVSLPVESISCFGSADIAFDNIVRTYLEPGTEALLTCHSRNHLLMAKNTGANVIRASHEVPLEPQIVEIINQIGPRTRLIYIGGPDRLTGASFSEAEIVFLLAYTEQLMVVIDESYFEYSGKTVASLTKRFPNLIVIRSISKVFGMGFLNAGYIITDPENLAFIHRIKNTQTLSEMNLVAAIAALDDGGYLGGALSKVRQAQGILAQNLSEIGYQFKMVDADFFLIKTADPDKACCLLLENNIQASDLSSLEGLEGWLRISINDVDHADKTLLILSRMASEHSTGLNRINRLAQFDESLSRIMVKA